MRLTNHIHAIKIPFKVNLPDGTSLPRVVYVYLIYTDNVYLIDSGVKGSAQVVFDYLRNTGKTPSDIDMLILTHSHPDHIGAARSIQASSGCAIVAHAAERGWIEDTEKQFRDRPVPGFHGFVEGPVFLDKVLEDDETLDLNDLSLKVIHIPGHSPGSIALYCSQEKALFSGDGILRYGDLPIYDDAADVARSLKNLKEIKDVELLLSAWDDPRKGGEIPGMIDGALEYLKKIHRTVIALNREKALPPMELCAQGVKKLGLPRTAINPLVAKSFASHIKNPSLF